MEYEETVELTRSYMLERLQMRYLYLTNGETMALNELQTIYNNFMVPREQRVRRRPLDIAAADAELTCVEMVSSDELSLQMEQLMSPAVGVSSVKKRQWNEDQVFNERLLSQATKRLKIHSP